MASPAPRQQPSYSSAAAALHALGTTPSEPLAGRTNPVNSVPPADYQSLLLAREQHRASLLGRVNNHGPPPSPSVASLLHTLNGKQLPDPKASLPPGIANVSPRPAAVDVGAAQATINAVSSALESGPVPWGTGTITPHTLEATQNALDTATATQACTDKVVVSGPGAGTLLGLLSTRQPATPAPQAATPAQQIYLSPADRFGLVGLLALIKSSGDTSMLATGTDLRRMGMNLESRESLGSSFLTPWPEDGSSNDPTAVAQAQTSAMVEPEYHLPACYNVQPPPPAHTKIRSLTDETLFFIFYSAPRDALQESAARELYTRGWRYHKKLRVWLTKDATSEPIQRTGQYERGTYIFFDPAAWEKVSKLFTLYYDALEERTLPDATLTAPSTPGAAATQRPQFPLSAQAQYGLAHAQAVQALAQQRRSQGQ